MSEDKRQRRGATAERRQRVQQVNFGSPRDIGVFHARGLFLQSQIIENRNSDKLML